MFRDMKGAGFNMIKLSGGEPLMRPDIFELANMPRTSAFIPALDQMEL
ncbi:MAG: hypothetical protein SOU08_03750 [Anaerococcus sp.]|nr:hypothetical protein [Anaerococcus sp.]